jgi:hypothetical protein
MEMALFDTLAMVSLGVRETEESLFEKVAIVMSALCTS